jgi:hypothetical protein
MTPPLDTGVTHSDVKCNINNTTPISNDLCPKANAVCYIGFLSDSFNFYDYVASNVHMICE